jgi:hypothetical protein
MTGEQIAALVAIMKKRAEEATPESAREWLYRLGTHNKDGSITKQYGGDRTDENHPAFSE